MDWREFVYNAPHLNIPQLSDFRLEWRNFAFLVECRSDAAKELLQANKTCIQPGLEYPIDTQPFSVKDDAQRATPAVDDQPSAWLFPIWKPGKATWKFGTYQSDIILPNVKRVSRRHFAMYLNAQNNWMVQNHSAFGMYINGMRLEKTADSSSCGALNPDIPNVIIAGMLEIIIYPIFHTAASSTQSLISYLPDFSNMELASETSLPVASTIGISESTLQPLEQQTEHYYYLYSRQVPVQSRLRVFMAVHRRTGYRYIAKTYGRDAEQRAEMQWDMMQLLKDSSNILSYNEYINTVDTFTIITPYLEDVELLANVQEGSSVQLGFIVFKQIARALEAMEKHGVVHHDVSKHTIIIQHVLGQYKAYITGFSEFDAEKGQIHSFRHDLSCLASTVMGILPTYNGRPCCDPTFRSLLSKSIQNEVSASQACLLVEDIAAGFVECPFKTTWVSKEMSIKRIVDENNVEGLRLLDFLRIVLHHNARDTTSMENLIKNVVRRERLFQLGSETFCYLEDAQRLLHHVKSQHSLLILDLCPPSHREACWYETKHNIDIPISYHEPSQMVNITPVLNLFDNEDARICVHKIVPTVQELRGSRQWEGYYIDIESMYQVLGRFGLKMGGIPEMLPTSSCAFNENDSNRFVIVATEEMIGFLFLNRDGKTVKWNENEETTDEAVKICEEHGLLIAQRAIREGIREEPLWTSCYSSEQIMSLFDGESPSEATEHNSFVFSTSSKFAFKKRKRGEDVPTLPLPRGPLVGQTTGTEKCETWVKGSASIRQTRFKK